MIALLLQLVMGVGFGVTIARDPEDIVWKKLGIACVVMAAFLSASLHGSDATGVERMSLILFLLIPFLWGVSEGIQGRLRYDRRRKK